MSSSESDEDSPSDVLLPDGTTVQDFSKRLVGSLVGATKSANNIATGSDHAFYSTFPAYRQSLDRVSRSLLDLTHALMTKADVGEVPEIRNIDVAIDDPTARFKEDIVEYLDTLYDEVVRPLYCALSDFTFKSCIYSN